MADPIRFTGSKKSAELVGQLTGGKKVAISAPVDRLNLGKFGGLASSSKSNSSYYTGDDDGFVGQNFHFGGKGHQTKDTITVDFADGGKGKDTYSVSDDYDGLAMFKDSAIGDGPDTVKLPKGYEYKDHGVFHNKTTGGVVALDGEFESITIDGKAFTPPAAPKK